MKGGIMEFMFGDLVRHGYGFYNPNHAAALICSILPFVWFNEKWKYSSWILTFILLTGLILTCSRSGIIIIFFELTAFAFLTGKVNRRQILIFLIGLTAVLLLFGVFKRFVIDKSITNRLLIYHAGIKIFAANPCGVGWGNSGNIASAFLLKNINCRTLINSHLTLLVEGGIVAGLLWGGTVLYALIHGIKKNAAAWCGFAGLTLSATFASIFDWGVLFDFHNFGGLPVTNFIMSWILFLFFISLLIYLIYGKINQKKFIWTSAIIIFFIGTSFLTYSCETPKVKSGFIFKKAPVMPLILYDETWNIKSILPYLYNQNGYILPLSSGFYQCPANEVYFFGHASEYRIKYPTAVHHFF